MADRVSPSVAFTIRPPGGTSPGAIGLGATANDIGTALTIPNGTWTPVPLDSATDDPGGYFDIPNHRFIAPIAGRYFITGNVQTNSGTPWAGIMVNGTAGGALIAVGTLFSVSVNNPVSMVARLRRLNKGDAVYLGVTDPFNAGKTLQFANGILNNYLDLTYVAA